MRSVNLLIASVFVGIASGTMPLTEVGATIVVAIAAGATAFSHVNDSGFWIISLCFCLTEKQRLRTWFFVSTTISFVGLVMRMALWPIA